jgi:hypothetical protein
MARAGGNVFRPGTPIVTALTTLAGITIAITPNTTTNTADIQVIGIAATTVNWRVTTIVTVN